jgi:hypothetical protein
MLRRSIVVGALLFLLMGALAPVGFAPLGGTDRACAQAGGEISGTVTSASEPGGMQDVLVHAYSPDLQHGLSTWTAPDGTYTLGGLFSGDYYVVFIAGPDYLEQWYSGKDSIDTADSVSVTEGSTTTGIDAFLEPAGKISGTVTSASEPGG